MINGFITIGTLQLLAVISPGPDFAMIVKNTLAYTRRTGIFTAAGIASGVIFHMTYCLLGFALLIRQSLTLFTCVKYLGAGYLIYVGIKSLLSRKSVLLQTAAATKIMLPPAQAFWQGFLCNVLNPKAALFFLGLFTLVIAPDTPLVVQAGYGIEIIVITFLWFSLLVALLTHSAVKKRLAAFQYIIDKVIGLLLIIFGAELAFFERH